MSEGNVQRIPLAKDFADRVARDYSFGDLIPKEVLERELDCIPPAHGTQADYSKIQFQFLSEMTVLRTELLHEYSIYLENVRGRGERLVPPVEQTDTVMRTTENGFSKFLRKGFAGLRHIQHDKLDTRQRQQNFDAQARLASVTDLAKRVLPGGAKRRLTTQPDGDEK